MDGEQIQSLEDIKDDCKVLLVSENDQFLGLKDINSLKDDRKKRFEYASEVKLTIKSINKDWTQDKYR